jgi:molecular chaperone DnaK (HSP70)
LTKARARFSIGIDLGTTNSALAFAPLVGEGNPEILFVPQWETLTGPDGGADAAFLPLLTGGSRRSILSRWRGRSRSIPDAGAAPSVGALGPPSLTQEAEAAGKHWRDRDREDRT